jgi:hypothetical protein
VEEKVLYLTYLGKRRLYRTDHKGRGTLQKAHHEVTAGHSQRQNVVEPSPFHLLATDLMVYSSSLIPLGVSHANSNEQNSKIKLK